ncbi:DUF484 family protein [Denitrificimonas sp. JX-1]|uniref:DUF484 family protein n=1 Tax=Denitrificimonas halotolerans TaxID=3098930 RepID=A0ABU5GRQ5_9GAMM|nr:DUF484 family protein [Denitrificimonas sp. JX-1]MDY7218308.1 DUF484 family protein [Denitrificimonas sp. JX-1]
MSNLRKSAKMITAEQVAAYLTTNPEFFVGRDELIEQMQIPHERGEAISLVERQMQVLRERNAELHSRLDQLMSVARINGRLFDKTRHLALEMLDAQTIDELVSVVDDSLRHSFKVPFVGLIIFSDRPVNVGRSTTLASAQQSIGSLLNSSKPLSGVFRPQELAFLFGAEQAKSIKSAAITVLEHQGVHGVLAVGSADQHHYSNAVDTLFLTYLTDVLARLLPKMLDSLRAVK